MNALRHGLQARDPVLPGEHVDDYEKLLRVLTADLKPIGFIQTMLVSRIASTMWRLARVVRLETGALLYYLDAAEAEARNGEKSNLSELLQALRPPSAATDGAERLIKTPRSDVVRLGEAAVRDAAGPDLLSKLSRYETRLARALSRDLQELDRIRGPQDCTDH